MAEEWIVMIMMWGIVEGIQFIRKKTSRARMKAGAYWAIAVTALLMLGKRPQSVPDNPLATIFFLLSSLALVGFVALIIYWVRVGVAKLLFQTSAQPLQIPDTKISVVKPEVSESARSPIAILNSIEPIKNQRVRSPLIKDPIKLKDGNKTHVTVWYKSDYGIGEKRSDLYFMDFEIQRLESPEAGYKILHPHPRKEGQVVPRFVLDAEIEKPVIRGRTVSSACPDCRTTCSSPLEQTMYFKCVDCQTSWWQKR